MIEIPQEATFPERVRWARFRRDGDRSILTDVVVQVGPQLVEIRAAEGSYKVQRYRFYRKAEWVPEGEPETWTEARVELLLGLAGPRKPDLD